jgi:hypothetical protein
MPSSLDMQFIIMPLAPHRNNIPSIRWYCLDLCTIHSTLALSSDGGKGSGRGGGEEEEPPRPNHRLISWGSTTALCTRRPDSSAAASIAAASARSEPWCGGCPGCGWRGCDIRPRCPQVALSRGVETAAPAAVTTTGRASTDRNEWRKRGRESEVRDPEEDSDQEAAISGSYSYPHGWLFAHFGKEWRKREPFGTINSSFCSEAAL